MSIQEYIEHNNCKHNKASHMIVFTFLLLSPGLNKIGSTIGRLMSKISFQILNNNNSNALVEEIKKIIICFKYIKISDYFN